MTDTVRTAEVRIEGRVQGVWFRDWTRRNAEELGLLGWVRNRRDGSVEALFSGPKDVVAEMLERCQTGPKLASVQNVTIVHEGGDVPDSFQVRPTA